MTENGTKDAAEAALRELPSVLGASVREDIYGNPREVHVLVTPVPSLRDLARDIRSLLEERLGVPVDQRVISIAQLRADAVTQPATNGRSTHSTKPTAAASPELPPMQRRLRLHALETARRQGRVTVEIRLVDGDQEYGGSGTELDAGGGPARAAAAAAMEAAAAACSARLRLAVEHASLATAFEREIVLVSVLASGSQFGRKPVSLVGAQQVEGDVETAAALAALKAVNRVVEQELAR